MASPGLASSMASAPASHACFNAWAAMHLAALSDSANTARICSKLSVMSKLAQHRQRALCDDAARAEITGGADEHAADHRRDDPHRPLHAVFEPEHTRV